jgi:hypothetical protein
VYFYITTKRLLRVSTINFKVIAIKMTTCAVQECRSLRVAEGRPVIFHSFPKDRNLIKVWKTKCRRKDPVNEKYARVCSRHFKEDDYQRDLKHELLNLPLRRKLKPDAIPSVFPDRVKDYGNIPMEESNRNMRIKRKARMCDVQWLIESSETPSEGKNCRLIINSKTNILISINLEPKVDIQELNDNNTEKQPFAKEESMSAFYG